MSNALQRIFLILVSLGLCACSGKDLTTYTGTAYPQSSTVEAVFQASQVPKSCRVFAQVLVLMPADLSGKDIENAVFAEAGKRGADMVLIGQSRQYEDNDPVKFLYYGPQREYSFADHWGGWRFGYDLWQKQGDWLNIGYGELGNSTAHFDTPVVMQVAMLKCR